MTAAPKRRLKALPDKRDVFPDELMRACKRPLCGNQVTPRLGRSRPATYCSDVCRRLYKRERAAARATLLEAHRLADQYEINLHEPAPKPRQPARSEVAAIELALGIITDTLDRLDAEVQEGIVISAATMLERLRLATRHAYRVFRHANN